MKQLDKWLIENLECLVFKTYELSWIKEFLPELYDFSSEIEFNGEIFNGRGLKGNRDLALKVSIIESIERVVAIGKGCASTNGVAAHIDSAKASINAFCELIERDLFFTHYLTSTPMKKIENFNSTLLMKATQYIQQKGHELRFFQMNRNNVGNGIVCVISGKEKWGGVIGLALKDETIAEVQLSAFLEAFRQYWHLIADGKIEDCLTLPEFLAKNEWSLDDHLKLGLNSIFFSRVEKMFSNDLDLVGDDQVINYSSSDFSFENIGLDLNPFNSCPIKVVRCSGAVNGLYLGPANKASVSIESLKRFNFQKSNWDLNLDPHPIN